MIGPKPKNTKFRFACVAIIENQKIPFSLPHFHIPSLNSVLGWCEMISEEEVSSIRTFPTYQPFFWDPKIKKKNAIGCSQTLGTHVSSYSPQNSFVQGTPHSLLCCEYYQHIGKRTFVSLLFLLQINFCPFPHTPLAICSPLSSPGTFPCCRIQLIHWESVKQRRNKLAGWKNDYSPKNPSC